MTSGTWNTLALTGYLFSAIAALVVATWLLARRPRWPVPPVACAVAFAIAALWAIAMPAFGLEEVPGRLLLSATYLSWLYVLYRMFARDGRHASLGPIGPVVCALGLVALMQIALVLAAPGEPTASGVDEIFRLDTAFRLLFCVGALVLVHNLYVGATGEARTALRWPAAALGVMWFYDLNLYTLAYLGNEMPRVLTTLRGLVPLAMAVLVALGGMGGERQQAFRPSRAFAFQSFSLIIIGSYFLLMIVAFQGIAVAGGNFLGLAQVAFLVAASALALVVLPSRKLRSWLRITLTKHLFQHRYDYREEWLRFTRTMGRAAPEALPLRERVVQAVADVTDSPGGLLLAPSDGGGLVLEARWQWPGSLVPAVAMEVESVRFYSEEHFVVDVDQWRSGKRDGVPDDAVPQWIADDNRAWALVPLLHYERLLGVVVLARPAFARTLDWEDFDLLRVMGRQLASYLAEQASQDALGEAQRFDEFNRRIAFVMHDIKNLASQLSLLARNAQKHAEKPEFRADMLVTLKNSSDKLNALLARLGRYGQQPGESVVRVAVRPLLRAIAGRYQLQHKVVALDGVPVTVDAQPEALEQALAHLVQNAVEASGKGEAVLLDAHVDGLEAVVEVTDSGIGMSTEFVRTRLFKPFHSSKPGGFGIGAYEAREMIRAMGGTLAVETREGLGTRFVVRLPRAGTSNAMRSGNDRKTEVA